MLSGNELWSLVSLAVAFIALALGIYVVRSNPNASVATVFFLAMIVMFVGGCIDFLFMNAPDRGRALGLGRILLFILVLESGTLFYLATFLPYEKASGWFRSRWWLYYLGVMAIAVVVAALLQPDELARTSYGWGIDGSLTLGIWAAVIVSFALAADMMLAVVSRSTEDRKVRAQIGIVAVATTSPVVFGLLFAVLEEFGVSLPPILSPGYLVSAVIMAYAILRYRLFSIPVAREKGPEPSKLKSMEYGMTLLYLEKKGVGAFSAFREQMRSGSAGAIIGRTHPDMLRERYHLEGVPIIWLAQQPGESRIDPTNLGILQHSILEFMRRHEGAVVLLEGLEYLLANNPLGNVLKMMYALDDEVVVRRGLFIATLDPEIMSEQSLAMFVRDFNVVEEKGAGTEI